MAEGVKWPENWKPEKGAVVAGEIVRRGFGKGKYGKVPTVVLRRDDGTEVGVWLAAADLWEQWWLADPCTGDRVEVTCLGREGNGTGPWRFRLECEIDDWPANRRDEPPSP
jgi:hypothetical protein